MKNPLLEKGLSEGMKNIIKINRLRKAKDWAMKLSGIALAKLESKKFLHHYSRAMKFEKEILNLNGSF